MKDRRKKKAMKVGHKKTVRIDPELAEELKAQRDEFVKKFGREPGPGDPLFFDPDSDTPRPMVYTAIRDAMVGAMVRAGIDARLIHAFRRTGFMVSEKNRDRMSPQDLREWQAALDEYDRLQRTSH
jgi:integrase